MSSNLQLSHVLNADIIYKICANATSKATLQTNTVIQTGSQEALIFIVKYLNYYENNIEVLQPEHPLSETTELKDLFDLEEHIFVDLITFANLQLVTDIIKIAEELNMKILVKKLAAIIAYFMQNKLQ